MAALKFSKAQLRSFETSAQRAKGLSDKGFLAVDVDGVVARFAGKGKNFPDADMQRRMGPMLVLGALYLKHAKQRLGVGKYATRPEAFKGAPTGRQRSYVVSSLYASRTRARNHPRSASSADFHALAGSKPGQNTGALMRSLAARTSGRSAVILDAQGSSIGSSTYFKRIEAGAKGNKRGKKSKIKVGKFVRNQWKLNAVFKHLRANLLQPTDIEVQAMASAVGLGLTKEFWQSMQGKRARRSGRMVAATSGKLARGADPALYSKLVRSWVR